ncbi:protein of unknown function [Candidatus Nitrosocosmicus franklandus]|uniref:Uncharacterized protein n=1 Tax=Candidatus Nitrosocosmicus franklandianus TaxID=1798806 RepID=A0A484IBP0_9ARCH|nr:protein of unknown function [Candidatus Nitrosocosmicus franklandus]
MINEICHKRRACYHIGQITDQNWELKVTNHNELTYPSLPAKHVGYNRKIGLN